ncbi:Os08g0207300, partial [Oryza sativa Japonica Group]
TDEINPNAQRIPPQTTTDADQTAEINSSQLKSPRTNRSRQCKKKTAAPASAPPPRGGGLCRAAPPLPGVRRRCSRPPSARSPRWRRAPLEPFPSSSAAARGQRRASTSPPPPPL